MYIHIHHSIHQTRSTWSKGTRYTPSGYIYIWAVIGGQLRLTRTVPRGDLLMIASLQHYTVTLHPGPTKSATYHPSYLLSHFISIICATSHGPEHSPSQQIVDSGPDLKYQDTGLRLNICPILSVSFTIFNSPPSSV